MVEKLMERFDMGDAFSLSYDWMLNGDNKYVLCFYVNYYNNTTKVDAKTEEKVEAAISAAMDDYYNETSVG